jgi:pseudouridine synthase
MRPTKPKKPAESKSIRLHVAIAHSGLCSRRAAEQLIQQGRVEVNGKLIIEMGFQVQPEDEVRVDGQVITAAKHYTLVLNKPLGVVTTLFDPQGRPTIVRYLPDLGVQVKPVGRLDMDTEGVLLVTNDGELAQRLAHPRYGIEKEYKLRKGVFIEGKKTSPAKVTLIHAEPTKNTTGLKLIIHEGRKRQVRLMCESIGFPVKTLKRVRLGPIYVKGMRAGEARMLGKAEVNELRSLVGLPPA